MLLLKRAVYCPGSVLYVTSTHTVYISNRSFNIAVIDMETGANYYCDILVKSTILTYRFIDAHGVLHRIYALAGERRLELQARIADVWETVATLDIPEFGPMVDTPLAILFHTDDTVYVMVGYHILVLIVQSAFCTDYK